MYYFLTIKIPNYYQIENSTEIGKPSSSEAQLCHCVFYSLCCVANNLGNEFDWLLVM